MWPRRVGGERRGQPVALPVGEALLAGAEQVPDPVSPSLSKGRTDRWDRSEESVEVAGADSDES